MSLFRKFLLHFAALLAFAPALVAAENVIITGVPDYSWYAGCFGTASGNLMGYWDRHGFPNFYTGPTAGGVAPLDSFGANKGIRSLWASKAGFDGRPIDQPGHAEDYWLFLDEEFYSYESTAIDPYLTAGRAEHSPDCLGDFMGASQNKWADLDGECSGNIDAFAFNFWDKQGHRRVNFTPPPQGGKEVRDIQSGLRAWSRYRGAEALVFSQLADVNPNTPVGTGFTFEDLRAEIDAGFPVMLILQKPTEFNRPLFGMPRANPLVHAVVAYGYHITDSGVQYARFRTGWGDGDLIFAEWGPQPFVEQIDLPLRGVVGYRPLPKIKQITRAGRALTIKWEGPAGFVQPAELPLPEEAHWYVIERSPSLSAPNFTAVMPPTAGREATFSEAGSEAFYRIRLLTRAEAGR